MPITTLISFVRSLRPKDEDRNLVAAFFHMVTITLISTSLAQLSWFKIEGGPCFSRLVLSDFFTFGYKSSDIINEVKENIARPADFYEPDYELIGFNCLTPRIVNMIRIVLMFCFMAIVFSLAGFFLDIIGPKTNFYTFVRRNALPSICTTLWIGAIFSICYYIIVLLEESLENMDQSFSIEISFDCGFYVITAAGAVALLGIAFNLLLSYIPRSSPEQTCLINDWDGLETFTLPPPPPYTQAPPPYSP